MKNEKIKTSPREKMRKKAFSRWENEGGATSEGHEVLEKNTKNAA